MRQLTDCDVVVIGSGLGGLTCAAVLARAGLRTLVVERGRVPGGYAHAFQHGPYTIDPACHFTADRSLLEHVLGHLGVLDRVEIIDLPDFYTAHFPGLTVHAPLGFEAFVEEHVRLFPGHALAIRAFFELCREVHASAHRLPPRLTLNQLDEASRRYPKLFQYEKATHAEVLDELFDDDQLKAVCAAIWPYPGSPPSTMSFLTMAQIIMLHVAGTIYFKGSFQSLVDALVASLERDRGELAVNSKAVRIIVENGRALGVRLEDGTEIRANSVVSNADARLTFEELVGADLLPAAFVRKLRRMQPSLSAFIMYAATGADMSQYSVGHETFLHRTYDHEQTFQTMLAGHPGGLWLNVPTLADPDLAPAGHHVISMTALVPYDIGAPWEQERDRFAGELLDAFEPVVPGLRHELEILGTATPVTLEEHAGNSKGATYGWANTPSQSASRRLSRVTPIDQLFLAGHWTHPGTGTLRCLVSGLHTAMMMLDMRGMPLPVIEPDTELPPW